MRTNKWIWSIVILLLAVVLFIVIQQWGSWKPSAESISKKEAKDIVQSSYKGEVTEIKLKGQQYLVEMEKEHSLYKITIDAANGEVLSITKEQDKSKLNHSKSATSDILSNDEIKKIILSKTNGELLSLKKQENAGKNLFVASVKEGEQKIIYKIDGISGEILSRTQETEKHVPAILTEDKAIQLAINEVNGNVDEVEFEKNGDQAFYLVEVETEDEREAVVQIHAVTGKVLSITWDD